MSELRRSVFDYRMLRTAVGGIAFVMPWLVSIVAGVRLSSISAAYHTASRDWFVGLLFVVAAFLFAYNGKTRGENRWSNVAAVAAIVVALAPTKCAECATSPTSMMHLGAAFLFFAILAYFCLGPFRQRAWNKGGIKKRRAVVYSVCGVFMLASMATILAAHVFLPDATLDALRVTYWGEAVALAFFGVAWLTAGKAVPGLTDEEEHWVADSMRSLLPGTAKPQ